jgi:nitrogen regulatory protein P-II 1
MLMQCKRAIGDSFWLQTQLIRARMPARKQKWKNMKKIEAIVMPFKLDEVKHALNEADIDEMTVSEVKGFGRQKAHAEIFRGNEYAVDFLPEIKIELIVPDNRLDAAVAAIRKGAKTAKSGFDKVYVSQIDEAVRGRTEKMEAQTA